MKKGFTLIELLAVIVVLAIISVIAVPTLIGVVNKARLNALKSSAYGLIEASNLYYAQYGSNNYRFDITGSNITSNDTDKLLTFKGNVKQGVVIVSKKGQITVCVTDGKNSAYKNYNEEKVSLVDGKKCSIPDNSSIVYLDGTATLTELSNQELTDKIAELEAKITTKEEILNDIYPVGSIYMSVDNTNPNQKFTGTWVKIEDRFLLSSGSNYELGETGGNSSALYTPQGTVGNHTLTVNEMPSHSHRYTGTWFVSNSNPGQAYGILNGYDGGYSTYATGGNQPHNHPFTGTQTSIETMPPYVVVNVWKRTA